jgi:glyoxylase-like metal-dependent hydrolase (beta-lactamase superfamily II)
VVDDNDNIEIHENILVNVIYTPGHNHDCLSFEIQNHLFTGDALIPGIKVYTKSKHGNKTLAKETIDKINEQFNSKTIICPGHGDICKLGDVVISQLYNF